MKFETSTIAHKGDNYHIKEISASQRKELFKKLKSETTDEIDVDALSIKFGVDECKDLTIDQILEYPSTLFRKLATEVMRISGLTEESVVEAEKN